MIQLSRELIIQAVEKGILTQAQADLLWTFLAEQQAVVAAPEPQKPRFTLTYVLYYFGGMIAIGAMTLFMTLGFEMFGPMSLFFLGAAYSAGALLVSNNLIKRGLTVPAGILSALSVALVPLAVFGLQKALGNDLNEWHYRDYTQWIDWHWVSLEISTLLAGVLVLFWQRLPFTLMPVSVTLWFMSMDFAPLLSHNYDPDWKYRKMVSLVFGLGMILMSFYVDIRSRRKADFGFWLSLFGMLAFWGALSLMDSGSELGKFFYGCLNVFLVFFGALVLRRVFTVFGAIGTATYLGYLAYRVFQMSLMFPFALSALGLGIVWLGIWWQKHEVDISEKYRKLLPRALRETLDA